MPKRSSTPAARRAPRGLAAALLPLLLAAACAAAPRAIDEDPATGFAIYRSGRLDAAGLTALCRAGVREIAVLDGTASQQECRLRATTCPGLRVVYDRRQDPDQPLSTGFLDAFRVWVDTARRDGRKIAFRCRHGWHRAGRLAAYYQMLYQGLDAPEARRVMHREGRFMSRHPTLDPQVEALADRLASRPCSTAPESCPRPGGEAEERFQDDVCR